MAVGPIVYSHLVTLITSAVSVTAFPTDTFISPHTIDPKYAYSVPMDGNVDDYNRGYVDDNSYGIFLFALRARA